eukprot:3256970-Pyramimonas_sp.AAC.1
MRRQDLGPARVHEKTNVDDQRDVPSTRSPRPPHAASRAGRIVLAVRGPSASTAATAKSGTA